MSYQGNVLAGISGEFSEVSEWDIENAKCRKIWCSLRTQNSLGEASTEANIDQELRKVYNNNLSINEPKESIDEYIYTNTPKKSREIRTGVQAIVQAPGSPLLFAAGSDRRIRMWDMENVNGSKPDIASGWRLGTEVTQPAASDHEGSEMWT
ncbi:MAG: hypothetical protein SGCHY_000180 [Lobulomycetales sp.]